MKKPKREIYNTFHKIIHSSSMAYEHIERGRYEEAKRELFKMCDFVRRELMDDMKKERKSDNHR